MLKPGVSTPPAAKARFKQLLDNESQKVKILRIKVQWLKEDAVILMNENRVNMM